MSKKAKQIMTGVGLIWMLTGTGCGFYSMAGSIPPHIKSIALPLVGNETAELGMAETVTAELEQAFIDENILRVVDEDRANSVLRGTIISIDDSPYTFSKQEAVTEYRYTIQLDLEWVDLEQDKVLISRRFSGWGAYGLSGDISTDGIDNDGDGVLDGNDSDEVGDPRTFARETAVRKIAEDVLNEIKTSW